ncbi:MAG: PAS domain S-box protein [Nitrospinae bacterium]|nr:PAS domain S-box protein [Nitrospinota bacterium]
MIPLISLPRRILEMFRRKGLFSTLLTSHLAIALAGLMMLVSALAATLFLRTNVSDAVNRSSPLDEAASTALNGIYASTSSLRGWVALGEGVYRDERNKIWKEDIDPAMTAIEGLSARWPGEVAARVAILRVTMEDLRESQWWVEDVAHTPGAEPARMLYENNLPTVTEITQLVSTIIRIEEQMTAQGTGSGQIIGMADFRFNFTDANGELSRYIDTGAQLHRSMFEKAVRQAEKSLNKLIAGREALKDEQRELLSQIPRRFDLFKRFSTKVVELRSQPGWNVAMDILGRETGPLARKAAANLEAIHQAALKDTRTRLGEALSAGGLMVARLSAFIVTMTILSSLVASRVARRIAGPISALLEAEKRLGEGSLIEDIPVAGDEEIAMLIQGFNDMRRSLAKGEADLRESETRYRSLMEQAGDAILLATEDARIIDANRMAERLFGRTKKELTMLRAPDIIPDDLRSQSVTMFRSMWETGGAVVSEREVLGASGKRVPVSITGSIITAGGKKVALGIFRDMTEQRRRREVEAVNKSLEWSNKELSEFAAVASHDLQAPLRSISGFSERLLTKYPEGLDEKSLDYLRRINTAAARMRGLITALLEYSFAARSGGRAEPVNLEELIKEILEDLRVTVEESAAKVEIEPLPAAYGDRTLLRQAFQNILSNSLKYRKMDVPPVVRIWAASAETGGAFFTVSVEDNGIGFDQAHSNRIFKIFERLHSADKYQGTGIGLATTKKIIERHGGSITAFGRPGEGARFDLRLPLAGERR